MTYTAASDGNDRIRKREGEAEEAEEEETTREIEGGQENEQF